MIDCIVDLGDGGRREDGAGDGGAKYVAADIGSMSRFVACSAARDDGDVC